jgi:hypothetical protein
MNRPLLILSLLPLLSCTPRAPEPAANAEPNLSMFPTPAAAPRDANAEPPMLVHVSVYRIALPAKSISGNEEFWKHVEEDGLVDIVTHDLLYNNGFRVGVAPRTDWDYFKKIFESQNLISQETRTAGVKATVIEMQLRPGVLRQLITFFHPTNGLVGQVYDRCENAMTLRFEPVPRRPGDVRVTATPLLRSERTELMFTVRNEMHELKFIHPEYVFDMKLAVDVPLDHFLIIAPSPESDISTSLGRRFLFQENDGQEFEQVLLISPQPFQLEKKPTTGPTTAPALPTPLNGLIEERR